MSTIGLAAGLAWIGVLALLVAFSSSTQDIVVDAWRIEAASDSDELGLLSAAYQFGYRIAILVSEAAILIIANHFGWRISYTVMAALMAIGVSASLMATEPLRAKKAFAATAEMPLWTPRGFFDAVIGPFREFFRVYGWLALLMLAMISFYQLPEYMTGPMYNPLYHDIGLSKDVVGAVRASIGLVATLVGITAGGFCALRFGYMRTLIAGVILKMLVIANFATLALCRAERSGVRCRDCGRQFRDRLRRCRAGDLHVEPDESWLYCDAVRAAQLGIHLRRQVRERVFRSVGRAARGRTSAARRLRTLLHWRRSSWPSCARPLHRARACDA